MKIRYGFDCHLCSGALPGMQDEKGANDPCQCEQEMARLREVASTAMAGCNARDEIIGGLEAEVARLKHRLEVDVVYRPGPGMRLVAEPAPEGIPDGIDCRDETIRGLEAEVERLRLALKNALDACAHWRNRAMEATSEVHLDAAAIQIAAGYHPDTGERVPTEDDDHTESLGDA